MPGIKRRKGIKLHKPKKAKQKRKNPVLLPEMYAALDMLFSGLVQASTGASTSDLCGASTPHSRNILSSLRYLYHFQTAHSKADASMFLTEDLKFLIVATADQELIAAIQATVIASGKIITGPGAIVGKPN